MTLQLIRCFIFDLDGTLVFNEHVNSAAYQAAFASLGLAISDAEYHEYFGLNVSDMLLAYTKRHRVPHTPELLDRLIATKAVEYKKRLHLIEQNHATIGLLRALAPHYHTALATTARRGNALAVLETFGLLNLFDFIVCGDDVSHGKPDPECHHIIAKHFNVQPEECMVFEDSTSGIAAAKAFGAHIYKVVS